MAPPEDLRDRRRVAAFTTLAPAMPSPIKGGAEEGSRQCDHRTGSAQRRCVRRGVLLSWLLMFLVLRETLMLLLSLVWLLFASSERQRTMGAISVQPTPRPVTTGACGRGRAVWAWALLSRSIRHHHGDRAATKARNLQVGAC